MIPQNNKVHHKLVLSKEAGQEYSGKEAAAIFPEAAVIGFEISSNGSCECYQETITKQKH